MIVRAFAILVLLTTVTHGFAQGDAAKHESAERELQTGEIALKQGRFAEAKQHFEAAERLGLAASAAVNAGIAIAELQMGHYEAARAREATVLKLVTTDHERAE